MVGAIKSITLPVTVIVLFLIGLVIVVMVLRDDTPVLAPEVYTVARARWERDAYDDYTVDVLKELDRQAPERVQTIVRGGRVTSFRINDKPMPLTSSYTIEGLFDMIERELEMAESGVKQPGEPREITLRAMFDEKTGIPLIFKRLAANGKSVVLSVKTDFLGRQ